jgi:adhesin/invasin
VPVQVKLSKDGDPLVGVKQIAAGGEHVLALMNDHTVRAWGNGAYGRLGNGDSNRQDQPSPVRVRSKDGDRFSGVEQIAGGGRFSLALKG